MAEAIADARRAFLNELFEHKLLIQTGVPGVYGRGGVFEDVIDRIGAIVTALGAADGAEVMRFPPVLARETFVRSEYLKSFPDLAGAVYAWQGNDKAHAALLHAVEQGGPWGEGFAPADVVLTPAACYPVYPTATGTLPEGGRLVDVLSYCFRHEPSDDPARMQSFRQREHVRIATPDEVRAWRGIWMARAEEFVTALELDGRKDVANDPFFGRAGRMLAVNQRDQELKFEMLVPICSIEEPTACISFNYHQDHFGTPFGIRTSDGQPAHTACVGFGLERIALALFKAHGPQTASWPAPVRQRLWGR